MAHEPRKPDNITQEEWDAHDVPELTAEDLPRLRPMAEVFAERTAKNKGGRPKLTTPTAKAGWRLPVDLLAELRATGKGYTDRIEALLREALAQGRL